MKNITVAEYKTTLPNYRQYLLKNAKKKVLIKINDKRVKQRILCACCGDVIARYDRKIKGYAIKCGYYKLTLNNNEIYYICYNGDRCRKKLLHKQGNVNITLYRVEK